MLKFSTANQSDKGYNQTQIHINLVNNILPLLITK